MNEIQTIMCVARTLYGLSQRLQSKKKKKEERRKIVNAAKLNGIQTLFNVHVDFDSHEDEDDDEKKKALNAIERGALCAMKRDRIQ